MPTPGALTSKFSRTYVYLNPDVFKGPYTQRLSNIPAIGDIPGTIDNLYTIAPLAHTEAASTANIYFSIEDIPLDIHDPAPSFTTARAAENLAAYAPYKSTATYSGLMGIDGIRPIKDSRVADDVSLWFSIDDLPNVDAARDKRRIYVELNLPYNSRSIQSLTATAPINVRTVSDNATVTFDITTLPDA